MTAIAEPRNDTQPDATYTYKALDDSGAMQTGELGSRSKDEAISRLRRLGLRPISITETGASAFGREYSMPGFGPRVKGRDLAVMARQFATMINAGVPMLRTLEVLASQSTSPVLASTLDQVRFDVEGGESLSNAIGRHPKVFDTLFVSMVRAGETAGALDSVLLQLASTLEQSVSTRQKIRSALAYPIAVSVMVVGVITVMLLFVVPTFAGIYDDLGGTLPAPTQALVDVSAALTGNLPLILLLIVGSAVALRQWKRTEAGRYRWDWLMLRVPLVGNLLLKSSVARFGRTMAVLTKSGVPVLETLRIASGTVGNDVFARALLDTREAVRDGEPLAKNLGKSPVFPTMAVQLIAVGEETGALDEMFDIVATSFEEEVEAAVSGFSAVIEPVMMALIGLLVGGMVIALYLPMFRVIDLVQ